MDKQKDRQKPEKLPCVESGPPKRTDQNEESKVKKNKVKARKGDIKERHTWKQRRDELKKKKTRSDTMRLKKKDALLNG